MKRINVAFQEGFDRDPVIAFLDEKEFWRSESASTRMQIGLAASAEVEVEEGKHRLRVSLPGRGLQADLELEVPPDINVGVSIIDGQIRFATSVEPFRYA